jgi:hypothetical protein
MSGTFWKSSASEFVSSPFRPLAVIWRWKWLTEPSGCGSVRHFTNNAEACKVAIADPGERCPWEPKCIIGSQVTHEVRTDLVVVQHAFKRKECDARAFDRPGSEDYDAARR